jgi:hypothetical protein
MMILKNSVMQPILVHVELLMVIVLLTFRITDLVL